jgi:hypothetical protein
MQVHACVNIFVQEIITFLMELITTLQLTRYSVSLINFSLWTKYNITSQINCGDFISLQGNRLKVFIEDLPKNSSAFFSLVPML